MHRIAARAALAPLVLILSQFGLTGCAPPATVQAGSYRSAAAPMYSTAGLPVARMVGTWRQVAGFGAAKPCSAAPALQVAPSAAGSAHVQYDLCLGGQRRSGAGALASGGAQGRYRLPGLPVQVWVLWMDEGNRSMAIGTPSGSFGAILSKDPISSDRLQAARDILAWNGYDLTQLNQY